MQYFLQRKDATMFTKKTDKKNKYSFLFHTFLSFYFKKCPLIYLKRINNKTYREKKYISDYNILFTDIKAQREHLYKEKKVNFAKYLTL